MTYKLLRPFYLFVAQPILLVLSFTLGFAFNEKIRKGLRLRFKFNISSAPHLIDPIWFHCASGEFEYAKAVIREIKNKNPHQPVIVSYFSPTYIGKIESDDNVDFCFPLPFDLPGPIRQIFKSIKPKMVLIARTDLWPEFLFQAKQLEIPVHLFSAARSDLSCFSLLQFFPKKLVYNLLTSIFCVSERDKNVLENFGVKVPIYAIGDTRYDQVIYRLETSSQPVKNQLHLRLPTIVAGSTWKEDEKVILPAFLTIIEEFKKHGQSIQILLAPHEPNPTHLNQLKKALLSLKINFQLYSQAISAQPNSLLIIDEVGVLAELYKWGDSAFVGGSFKSTVHSVMEPLGAGLITLVGPKIQNNREALEFSQVQVQDTPFGLKIVNCALDSKELAKIWIEFYKSKNKNQISTSIKTEVQNKLGASKVLYEQLFDPHPKNDC